VDFSDVALDALEVRARSMHVSVKRGGSFHDVHGPHRRGLELLHVDLEQAHLPAHAYDLIVCIQFLQRLLFPQWSAPFARMAFCCSRLSHARNLNFRVGRGIRLTSSKSASSGRHSQACVFCSTANCAPGRESPAWSRGNGTSTVEDILAAIESLRGAPEFAIYEFQPYPKDVRA